MNKSTNRGAPAQVALCALRYAPADPQYRTLAPLALACQSAGMSVGAYALEWQGGIPQGVELIRPRALGLTTRAREKRYWRQLADVLRKNAVDCAVGFEAQPCFDIHIRSAGVDGEQQMILGDGKPTQLSPIPWRKPQRVERPPHGEQVVFAMAGGDLVKRGFERLVVGIGRQAEKLRSRCRIIACGQLEPKFLAAAQVLQLRDAVEVDAEIDPREALRHADLFVDLSYEATANPWIYDALASSVAVITHNDIAEAELVRNAKAGVVLDAPFRQEECNRVLADVVTLQRQRQAWRRRAAGAASSKWFGHAELVARQIKRMAATRR